jgi:hypothetical protein
MSLNAGDAVEHEGQGMHVAGSSGNAFVNIHLKDSRRGKEDNIKMGFSESGCKRRRW